MLAYNWQIIILNSPVEDVKKAERLVFLRADGPNLLYGDTVCKRS